MNLRKSWLVAIAASAGAMYLTMWVGFVMQWCWLVAFDDWALHVSYRYGADRPGWVIFWDVLCMLLGPTAFRLVGLALLVVALVQRNLRIALFLLVSVELSGLVMVAAKLAANRPRPDTELVRATGSSFPSGHALTVMVGVLALSVVVLPRVRRSAWWWMIAAGALAVLAVGIGRVVLNVHHPSDVLAGWALGYLWFAASVPILTRHHPEQTDVGPIVSKPLLDPQHPVT